MSETVGGVVHLRWEREPASGHWLLAAAENRPQAKAEWNERGVAWLRPGALFSAVAIQAIFLHAAVGFQDPQACAGPLAEVLGYGPVFYSQAGFQGKGSYTALVPARVARLRVPLPGVVTLPQRALLLVPAPPIAEPVDGGGLGGSLEGPALLCPPERVAALASFGRDVLAAKGPQDA